MDYITTQKAAVILQKSGFTGYRFNGALEWITKTIKMLRAL